MIYSKIRAEWSDGVGYLICAIEMNHSGNEVRGICYLGDMQPNMRAAHIRQLFVHEDSRLQGVGSAMLSIAETTAARWGKRAISLYVDKEELVEFYEKAGYNICLQNSTGELYMSKVLPIEE